MGSPYSLSKYVSVCMSPFQLLNKLTNFYEIPYAPYDKATQFYFQFLYTVLIVRRRHKPATADSHYSRLLNIWHWNYERQ